MHLSPAMEAFILHWGEMGTRWGTNRSVAQIHALLHLASKPLTAEEIAETLNLARSNVSNGIKELQGWKLVKVSRQLGDRRDHFSGIDDMFDMVRLIIEARRAREFRPTVEVLRGLTETAEADGTPSEINGRMRETLKLMEEFDAWYGEMSKLPRSTQMAMLKMGARLARLLPKSAG